MTCGPTAAFERVRFRCNSRLSQPSRRSSGRRDRDEIAFVIEPVVEQIIQEVVALMADAWLVACERRVIAPALDWKSHMVIDVRENARLFGPASGDECRQFVHRAAALDVLRAIGSFAPAATAAAAALGNGEWPPSHFA
jgi:hypothetical protein